MKPLLQPLRRPLALLLLAASIAGLSACTVTPPRVAFAPPVIIAPIAPPPPRVEVIPVAPRPDYFWIPGYWHYEGGGHRWVEGRWEERREHEHWVPHHWERQGNGQWHLNGGYWHRD